MENEEMQQHPRQAPRATLSVPAAIIIAGFIIAGAIFISREGASSNASTAGSARADRRETSEAAQLPQVSIRPIGERDHVRGNPNAKVVIVEYSDTECPFCKRFHPTLQRIIDEYGKAGSVAWVYRHFPLDSLHAKARNEAEATECAAELGGNAAFWAYLDELFEVTPSNDGLSPSELPRIAERVGIERSAFEQCLASGRHAARVEEDYQEAVAAGGTGTPYSVIITSKGETIPIHGAQPYASVRQTVAQLLSE